MARRIDIELTSTRPDGTWTWRAAGAKEPRGIVDGSLLYEGAKPGDVVKAEAEFEIEGISITSVAPPKSDNRTEAQRIELLGPSRGDAPGVTTQLVGRTTRRREGPDGRPGRDGRPTRERPPRDRADRDQSGAGSGRPRLRRDQPRRDGGLRETGGTGGGEADSTEESPRRRERPAARKEGAPRKESGAGRSVRPGPGRPSAPRSGEAEDRKSKRLNPGHAHRQAMLASLPPEQQPVAEQVLRGGIPAVRTALHLEREKAAAEGRPAPNTDQLIAMAEELLPRLKAAEWRDRAEAAAKDADAISLRDLRSVVAGSDVARDDETRALAATLREALEKRVAGLHDQWVQEIVKHLDDNRVVRALRLSARPPEPLARLDAELSQRLTDAASQAMAPDTPHDRWLALLDAASASPVRRSIRPVGLPTEPDADVKQAAYQQSGRIPALAVMLGVSIPPPPSPTTSRTRRSPSPRRAPSSRPSRPTTGDPATPEDQATPRDQAATEDPAATEENRASAEGGENPTVVEELGEPVDEPKVRDLG